MNPTGNHHSRGGAENTGDLDDITGAVIDSAMRLHSELGPGLLESVYEAVLAADLSRKGWEVERQKAVPFEFDGLRFDEGLRIDLLVGGRVRVIDSSTASLLPLMQSLS